MACEKSTAVTPATRGASSSTRVPGPAATSITWAVAGNCVSSSARWENGAIAASASSAYPEATRSHGSGAENGLGAGMTRALPQWPARREVTLCCNRAAGAVERGVVDVIYRFGDFELDAARFEL